MTDIPKTQLINANYLLDDSGNYLRIVGNYHDVDAVYSYIKYFPSEIGTREINGRKHQYSSFIQHSFELMTSQPHRYRFSPYLGETMICTPRSEIIEVFDCREAYTHLNQTPDYYSHLAPGRELQEMLRIMPDYVDPNFVGISGSFLLGCPNDESDIDLVCYGREGLEGMRRFFDESGFVIPYKGDAAISLYNLRKKHMDPMRFDVFAMQENRKLIGMTRNGTHIVCQAQRGDEKSLYDGESVISIGEITCLARIIGDVDGYYAPAYYEIEVNEILGGFVQAHDELYSQICVLVSYQGFFANSFRNGDNLYISGKLICLNFGDKPTFGIELSSLGRKEIFQANLRL